MKIHHFVLLFLIFFLAVVLRTDISIGELKTLENEKSKITSSLNTATSDAINYLATSGEHGANSINKDEVLDTFFQSLYSSMGIISDTNAQEELEMFIPVILLCDSDGYYVYYYDEYRASDGYTYAERLWSEKMPYYYRDGRFTYCFSLTDKVSMYDANGILESSPSQNLHVIDYHEIQTEDRFTAFRLENNDSFLLNDEKYELVKKEAIISQLEETMAYYTSKHNEIALMNGITYTFSFPSGHEEEWADYIEDVSLLVVFQGYPYGIKNDYTFNKIASAGANIVRKPVYYVEEKSWYYLAHLEGCEKLASSTTVLEETFDSVEQCAKIGAYCCECIEHGARVPDID